jgi:hypothetical protein
MTQEILWVSQHPLSANQAEKLAQEGYSVVAQVNHQWGETPVKEFEHLAQIHGASSTVFAGVLPASLYGEFLKANKAFITLSHKERGQRVDDSTPIEALVASLMGNHEVWNGRGWDISNPLPIWRFVSYTW